jgi:branched-subunit amino acid transport protein AzlD
LKTSVSQALLLTLVMGAVIFFCRAFPFLFFGKSAEAGRSKTKGLAAFMDFVEKTVPPAAMTVLAFNALASPVMDAVKKSSFRESIPVLAAAVFTTLVHLWKRNPLISIFGGTALYMLLQRVTSL